MFIFAICKQKVPWVGIAEWKDGKQVLPNVLHLVFVVTVISCQDYKRDEKGQRYNLEYN